VSTPATIHATRSHPGAPTLRDISADTMKMPDPIIDPTTTIVESKRPRPRVNSVSSEVAAAPEAAVGLAIGRSCIKMLTVQKVTSI
jgi:hypothetical protein